jgi:hypothetical protein
MFACSAPQIKILKLQPEKHCEYKKMFMRRDVQNKWIPAETVRQAEKATIKCLNYYNLVVIQNTQAARLAQCDFLCELKKIFTYGGIGVVLGIGIGVAIAL